MKKKTKLIFSFLIFVHAVLALISGCDMDGVIGNSLLQNNLSVDDHGGGSSSNDPSNDPSSGGSGGGATLDGSDYRQAAVDELGFFSGGLVNPSDAAAPVLKSGTKFEMNGYVYTVNSDAVVVPYTFTNTCIGYIYARLVFDELEVVYSTAAPVFDSNKNGYYKGLERALFKFVFIRDTTDKYFAKTFINDTWTHLRYQTTDSITLPSQNLSQHYYLSGTGNPNQQTVALPAGAYLIVLFGAPGGLSGANLTTPTYGGSGGCVSEVVLLSDKTSFTFFTGEKGGNGHSNSYSYSSGGSSVSGRIEGAGGGGSGSFAFSLEGYFLCAGGGGGSRGISSGGGQGIPSWMSSAGGGAGGSIGGGGAGLIINDYGVSSFGGNGGGINGGLCDGPRFYGYTDLTVHSYSLGFAGTNANVSGGEAAYFNLPPPNDWLNTNNANGKGGDSSGAAQAGGNNRNSTRGGGTASSNSSLPGSNGSVTVFKIN